MVIFIPTPPHKFYLSPLPHYADKISFHLTIATRRGLGPDSSRLTLACAGSKHAESKITAVGCNGSVKVLVGHCHLAVSGCAEHRTHDSCVQWETNVLCLDSSVHALIIAQLCSYEMNCSKLRGLLVISCMWIPSNQTLAAQAKIASSESAR